MQFLEPPQAFYVPKTYDDDLVAVWGEMNNLPTPEARQDAFVRMQKMVLDHAYALPFGALTKVQVLRANVKNFIPFRVSSHPRETPPALKQPPCSTR